MTTIFGPKEEKVTGCWKKKVPNEKLHSVYSSIKKVNKNTDVAEIQQRRGKTKVHIFKTAIETYNTGPQKELFNAGSRRYTT